MFLCIQALFEFTFVGTEFLRFVNINISAEIFLLCIESIEKLKKNYIALLFSKAFTCFRCKPCLWMKRVKRKMFIHPPDIFGIFLYDFFHGRVESCAKWTLDVGK